MSSRATFFVQECPTCGRRLRVCVEYLGKEIQCRHCNARFESSDSEHTGPRLGMHHHMKIIDRVNQLLATPIGETQQEVM